MLLKKSQIVAMNQHIEDRFLNRILRFIGDAYDIDPQDASVVDRCKDLMASARSYSFASELEIATFVSCGFAYGSNFDEDSELPFAAILQDKELDVEFKAERMAGVLDEGASQQAEESGQA